MSFVIDSNAPYFTEFPIRNTGDAVYMTAEDECLGHVFAIVYRAHRGVPKLSVILFGTHGTSGYVDMTLDRTSRYFGACRGLAQSHYRSPVRRALAIAVLRTYATVDKPLKQRLRGLSDEAAAGSLGSRFRLVYGKFPATIGRRVLEAGLISPKRITSSIIDIVYEDSDSTIDQNNELVYLLGEQLEQLFDPLSEYSPEPTEKLYVAPDQSASQSSSKVSVGSLDNEPRQVQDICEELYLLQAHARGDILDLLQTTLIPLRVEVLKGRFASLTIARLNSVFPPTIDELFRVNNLLYEALRAALPFGAFEVVRACGATIPYFFRACMRHEAATQNFAQLLADLLADEPDVAQFIRTDSAKLENVIRNRTHLLSLKEVLERLVKTKNWSPNEAKVQVDDFYHAAVSTVDAFDRKDSAPAVTNAPQGYGRKLASSSRFVNEIMLDWPAELENGWEHRRVVTVFDTLDILDPMSESQELHTVFIMFTDSLVLCQPTEPIPVASPSQVHMPSVGDLLTHAMINEAPLDRKLPPMKVVSWAPILDVHFASYDKQHLYVFSPGIAGSYRLLQPENYSDDLVTLLAKAKITTKTQPFHLFKIQGSETTVYSTVQELEGYKHEANRTNVALFLSTSISERTLVDYRLAGAVALHLKEDGKTVGVKVVSRMRYVAEFTIKKTELQELVVNELAYLMTLSLSSQNQAMLDLIIASNRLTVTRLIKWATTPEPHRIPRDNAGKIGLGFGTNANSRGGAAESPSKAGRAQAPSRALSATADRQNEPAKDQAKDSSERRLFVVPDESLESITPVNRSLRKIVGRIPPNSRDTGRNPGDEEPTEMDKDPSMQSEQFYSSYSLSSSAGAHTMSFSNAGSSRFESFSSIEASSEEAEQRDVDNWYHQLHTGGHDDQSLSSELSDVEMGTTPSRRTVSISSSIQIGGFVDKSASNLYNKNAGRAFPRIEGASSVANISKEQHRRQDTEDSFETIASLQDSVESSAESEESPNTTVEQEDEDFSYLADLVDTTSLSSKLSELERGGVYPDLRESSLVRLGSYILRTDKSQRDFPSTTLNAIKESQVRLPPSLKEVSPDDEKDFDMETPKLSSGKFSAAPASPDKTGEAGSFTPFANVEMADWHPRPVKSGTTATLSGLLPRVNRKAEYDASETEKSGNKKFSSTAIKRDPSTKTLDEEYDDFDEDATENAKRWLAWAESSGRPTSMLSSMNISAMMSTGSSRFNMGRSTTRSSLGSGGIPESKSQISFRRMVMSSSLHTLQLASFTVQVDQKESTSDGGAVWVLRGLKNYVTEIYKRRDITAEDEREVRKQLVGYYLLLMKYNCKQLAYGLLEIEWVRRSRIVEQQPESLPTLWKFD